MRVLLDTTFALRAPHSGTGVYLERLREALANRDDVTVLAVANRRRRALAELGLEPGRYILFVGRLEPDNNPHMLVDAFSRIDRAKAAGMKQISRRVTRGDDRLAVAGWPARAGRAGPG